MINVIGHLNPDTDSTVSAFVYAWFIKEHRKSEATAYLLGKPNKEAVYLFDFFQQKLPSVCSDINLDHSYVLVDTNNLNELPQDLVNVKLLEIVDHHKLMGTLSTAEPISVTIRPFGCTATVIWGIMQNERVEKIPEFIAGLLIGAIISDTLKFTSPTTTDHDLQAIEALRQYVNFDLEELSDGMFKVKSDLTGMSIQDILFLDSKVFEYGSEKVRISCLETTDVESSFALLNQIKEQMTEIKKEGSLDYMIFFVVDILHNLSYPIVSAIQDQRLVEKAFGVSLDSSRTALNGVVSRKKQIVPAIEAVLLKENK